MEEKKKSRKWVLLVILLLFLSIVGIVWWLHKFEVVIKYNNDLENTVQMVRLFGKVDESLIKEKLSKNNYYFRGFRETYVLDSNIIERINQGESIDTFMCEKGFTLSPSDNKCISETDFDFKNTRILKDTVIEVMWEKKEPVEENTGKKENATVTLSTNKKCIVGVNSSFDITAKIKGYVKDKTIKWETPKCYTAQRISDSHYKFTRIKDCEEKEEMITRVTVSLTNGYKTTIKIDYEPKLTIKVFDGNSPVYIKNNAYKANNPTIVSNIPATFKASKKNVIDVTEQYSVKLYEGVKDDITVKTPCNQSKVVTIK